MRRLLFLVMVTLSSVVMKAQLVINEVMQSNIDCVIVDDLNDTPDSWVELYNAGTSFVSTGSYSLGLTDNPDEAYRLPNYSIPPKAYFVVYCDKVGSGVHTNFRLESGKGGSIYLFEGKDMADSYVDMKKQPAPNISYGREEDGGSKFGYMLTPTPSAANKGGVVDNKKILGDPIFSKNGQVFTSGSSVSIQLSLPEGTPEGTVIRYTRDGSEPTKSSTLYTTGGTIRITTSCAIRAKLFCDGYLSPRSTTQSYIFHGREMTIPIVSINTDSKYFYDNKIGIYVEGTYKSGQNNFSNDWRRPMNIEYFDAANEAAAINQLCEARVQGGQSRNWVIKSLAVYANKRFGEKRFNYEFFPTEKPGINEFKSFILRNSGNDCDYMYFRDAAIQHNAGTNCDIDWQGWQPTAVYINGNYLGMLNIRERSNDDNIYSNYGGLEDIDMIENYYELKTGTMDEFNKFKDFYTASANSENTNMDNYTQYLDIDEYLNIMVVNTFQNNLDFPGNNIAWWRPRTEDGRWRIIMKDTDFGLGLYGRSSEYKYIDWLYNHDYDPDSKWANDYEHTRLFRRLMTDQRFKNRFIDRMSIFMGTFMNEHGLGEVIDSMYNVIKTEYPYHRKPINQWWPNHLNEVNSAKNWAERRTTFMWKYLKDYFKLSDTKALFVSTEDKTALDGFRLTINETPVRQGYYDGKFWAGREVRVSAESIDGERKVSGWKVESSGESKTYRGSSCSFIMPNAISAVVTPIVSVNGIESVESSSQQIDKSANEEIYTLDGKKVAAPTTPGVYVIRKGNGIRKIVKN